MMDAIDKRNQRERIARSVVKRRKRKGRKKKRGRNQKKRQNGLCSNLKMSGTRSGQWKLKSFWQSRRC